MKNQKTIKLFAILISLLLLVTLLASCSSAGKNSNDLAYDSYVDMDGGNKEYSNGSSLPTADQKGDMAEGSDDSVTGGAYEPKIIRTATVNAETKDFPSAVGMIEGRVKELGGYIEKSDVQDRSSYNNGQSTKIKYANYVIRIPAEKLDTFLLETGELLNVTSSNSTAADISGDYYDIQARISVLETEREVLEKMLAASKSVSEMISIEGRLYDVIYEIESYKTALKVYDSKVAYSTVNLNITEVADLTPTVVDESFGARFKNAVKESWDGFVEFCQEMIILAVYLLPVGAVAAVCAAVVFAVVFIIVKIIKAKVRRARAANKSE